MQVIDVVTYFDCTPTATKSYRKLQPNTTNAVGHKIQTMDDWNYSRNQQRNWETILQVVSLKTQAIGITEPVCLTKENQKVWQFTFGIEHEGIYDDGNDQLGLLKQEVHGVPMIVGLNETHKEGFLMPYLLAAGENQNIMFTLLDQLQASDIL
jgi:hypothetical protein